jgi:rRNA-processing protein FCF1
MKTVILDTSFLLTALQNKIDIKEELTRILDHSFQLAIIDKTKDELKGKKLENLAITFLKVFKVKTIPTTKDKNVDNHILEQPKDTIVATQDKKLKEKLKKRRMPIITIRQKRYCVRI